MLLPKMLTGRSLADAPFSLPWICEPTLLQNTLYGIAPLPHSFTCDKAWLFPYFFLSANASCVPTIEVAISIAVTVPPLQQLPMF